ncbi:66f8a4da-8e44-47cd-9638-d4564a310c63-CDS [Sclerotinia trifoliorum]|uniref:66f8a4da-8e44-47cd-9638-d4564a310c63-CDS n=1 Tax=Sclerotinia trifoliorum TaxID=28548 RepID=A0A8H2VS11_9HELO|nr:66f8a4da-8e44-47cd-9638-d4564a310c63-CDS [Sclerotinia trifoliorum]
MSIHGHFWKSTFSRPMINLSLVTQSFTGNRTMTSNPLPLLPFPKITPLPRSLYPTSFNFTRSDFRRQDESPDTEWYSQPRFVQHIDEGAIFTLKHYYSHIITPASFVLDICSSWVSHLPSPLKPILMIGIGMNEAELERNEHLTSYLVKDLNVDPTFQEVIDASMDVVICNVSVDYLTQPIRVFEGMRRVLKEGGAAHIAFSNRYFPTKAVERWLTMDDGDRRKWVGGYFWASGGWENIEEVVLKEGRYEDPLFVVRARKMGGI